jgi:hypothetical protein
MGSNIHSGTRGRLRAKWPVSNSGNLLNACLDRFTHCDSRTNQQKLKRTRAGAPSTVRRLLSPLPEVRVRKRGNGNR